MRRKCGKQILSWGLALVMGLSGIGTSSIQASAAGSQETDGNVVKFTMDETGYLTPTKESQELMESLQLRQSGEADLEHQTFSWDNATVYFVLTDRFKNGDTTNDYSYGRGLDQSGNKIQGLDIYTNPGTFHGGDLKGLTEKVDDGYFTDLGVNAIWITAPYEQIHGYTSANVKSNNANEYPDPDGQGFPYYSYHGYWTLDYTNIDENMGDEKTFESFVDSCHSRGIRVIMDVVMNHVGYTTMQDAVDYGFDGALKGDWKTYYYGNSTYLMGGDPESTNYWNKESGAWEKWWGPGFVRADYPGYTAAGGDDYHMSLCGLPDVMTESAAKEVPTPPLLVTKWTKEGRLDKEQKELDDFFKDTGYARQPRYYIIKWLTDWVREYGVDGFRCDTAKHVDLDAWNDLKTQSDKALKEWRANNPDKPGASWTDDFWMTGEAWGHGMGKSPYFTSGGFDSMINFTFPKNGNLASVEGTYKTYADAINSDPEFNVLSYLASHDDSACVSVFESSAEQSKNLGTSLLLAPGGVQIYYGNEVNRQIGWKDFFTGSDYLDQRFRTDMNWSSYDKDVLAHWQKLGQFRNKHLSVGAGQHEKLEGDVYTFSRTYHLEEEDEDKVVVALPGKAGTFSVDVGSVFEDGETITDFYSGAKYEVSGGAVSVACDAGGVILLEGSGIVKASVSAKTKGGSTTYKTDTIDITLKANKAKDTYYTINGGAKRSFSAGDVITIGGDTAYEEKTTIVVGGVSEDDGSALSKTVTYQRSEEPVVSDGLCVKVSKEEFSAAPNIYVYDADENALNGKWPGAAMEDDGDTWVYNYDGELTSALFILSQGTWRSSPEMQPGITFTGGVEYSKASGKITEIPNGVPGRVNIQYEDASGKELKSIYRVGVVGKPYKTYAADLEGYKLTKQPDNAEGTFAKDEITVKYVYTAGDAPIQENGQVIIRYVDKDGKEIAQSKTLTGKVGSAYEAKPDATIQSGTTTYALKAGQTVATGTYTAQDIEVTYLYEVAETPEPVKTGKVLIKYVDGNGNAIADTRTLTGEIGKDYEAKPELTIQNGAKTYQLKAGQTTATGTYTVEDITVTFVYEETEAPDPSKTGKVYVQYVDEEGNEIADSENLSGTIGTAYSTTGKETVVFGGKTYQLKGKPKNAAGTYTEKDIVVIYSYTEAVATGTVTIQFVDEEGNMIKDTVSQYGTIGETYAIDIQSVIKKDDKNYTLKQVLGNTEGQYTKDAIVVTFLYGAADPSVEEGTVVVKYVDEAGAEIMASRSISGTVGTFYTITVPETIKSGNRNYKRKGTAQNVTGTYQKGTREVICTYTLEEDVPADNTGRVTVKYVDAQGKEIIRSKTQTGTIGETYTTDVMSALTIENKIYRLTQTPQNASGTYTEGEIVVIYQYELTTDTIQKGNVKIQYIDEDGNSIKETQTISGTIGDSYAVDITSVIQVGEQTYQLKATPANASGQYTETDIIVTCVYKADIQPVRVGNVFVKYVDEDGHEVADAQMMSGNIGDRYTTNAMPAIVEANQTYLLKARPKNAEGQYSEQNIFVIYIYEVAKEPVSEGTVFVKYVDERGRELAESVTLTGAVGGSYATNALTTIKVEDSIYQIKITPGNAAGKYTADPIEVIYVYEEQGKPVQTGNVVVKCVDEEGKEIAAACTLSGLTGTSYTTSAESVLQVGEKTYQKKTIPANASGQYTTGTIEVVYVYEWTNRSDIGGTDTDKTDAEKTDTQKRDTDKTETGSTDTGKTGVTDTPQPVTETPVEVGDTKADDTGKGYYEITGTSAVKYTGAVKAAKQIVIPDTVKINGKTYRVTAVAGDAFADDTTLEEVRLGNNITKIGDDAFNGCKKLKKATLDSKLTTIGAGAFYGCSKLTGITIPAKVKKIGSEAFYGCKKLKKITIKTTKLTKGKVGSKAFKGIYARAAIKVPKSKLGSYKTILRARGVSKNAKIKK